jgi:phenylpropionate dioxygenase-like ring-hydroxylating dioxygenase large terminal subunit
MTTAAAPRYQAGVRLDSAIEEDALNMVARLVEHYKNKTTDQAPDQWHEPVRNYLDQDLWRREVQEVHHRVPLPLAMSCELPGPGSYKAITVANTPVIITRDADGQVHATINVCRHRGAELLAEGYGTTNRITCSYHSWSYDLSGCLVGIYGDKTFGDVDRDSRGLVRLPVEERAGFVWVGLTPGMDLDLDTWLAGVQPFLESLGLDRSFHYSTRELEGPNWKVVLDGYLEGYHFASLHRQTVFKTNLSNMAVFDNWGPHQRHGFALRPIADAVNQTREQWDPALTVGAIYWMFPGLAISGGWRSHTAVSLVLPGPTWGTSRTQQIIALRREPLDDEERKEAEHTRDWFHDVVLDEDYAMGYSVQRGLEAMADKDMIFGRNEPGVQHFHRALNEHLA